MYIGVSRLIGTHIYVYMTENTIQHIFNQGILNDSFSLRKKSHRVGFIKTEFFELLEHRQIN